MRRLIVNGNGKTLLLIISLAFNLGACLAVAAVNVPRRAGLIGAPVRTGCPATCQAGNPPSSTRQSRLPNR